MSEMGKPTAGNAAVPCTEFKVQRSEPREGETSQYLEEKESKRDSASSGERKRRRPNRAEGNSVGVEWTAFKDAGPFRRRAV